MGGAVSTGEDNDDLIDKLIEADYIKTPEVERIFRAVDRADYFTPSYKDNAYKDLAWKDYNLHISAPCIYSEVMERLKLQKGMSFLNMGSGTGYLSTMVGLSLGADGINHGIEIYPEVVEYANGRLDHFKRYSPAIDQYEFCNPEYVVGNCLCLPPDTRRYDRIYCGAGCPEGQEAYIKNLLKVGGILVMPMNDQLEQIERTSETEWKTYQVLSVSFSTLISPEKNTDVVLPSVQNRKLQDICRSVIRSLFRSLIEADHPNLKTQPPRVTRRKGKKRPMSQVFIPLMQHFQYSDNEEVSDHNETEEDGSRDSSSSSASDKDEYKMATDTSGKRRIERRRRRAARCAMLRAVLQQVASVPLTETTSNDRETEEIEEPPPLVEEESLEESADITVEAGEASKESQSGRKSTRETADSGVGDEIAESAKIDVPSESEDRLLKKMELDSDSDFEEEPTDFDRDSKEDSSGREEVRLDVTNPNRRAMVTSLQTRLSSLSSSRPQRSVCRARKGKLNSSTASCKKCFIDDDDSSDAPASDAEKEPSVGESYSQFMKEKIQQLPLPTSLQLYLNYNRPF